MSQPWNSQSDGSIHVTACAGLRSALSASAFYQLVLLVLCCPQYIIRTILMCVRTPLLGAYQSIKTRIPITPPPTQPYRRALAIYCCQYYWIIQCHAYTQCIGPQFVLCDKKNKRHICADNKYEGWYNIIYVKATPNQIIFSHPPLISARMHFQIGTTILTSYCPFWA